MESPAEPLLIGTIHKLNRQLVAKAVPPKDASERESRYVKIGDKFSLLRIFAHI